MYNFNIVRTLEPSKSFRAQSVIDRFSIDISSYTEEFKGSFELPDSWNIGLIVGRSGTGKTTIANELFNGNFKNEKPHNTFKSVIDEMPAGNTVDDITKMFNSVGFSSPPSWLKPYHVLSNGEKMRVDLAAALLSNNALTVFDEFTSVVDRQVAKIASHCVQKAVRKAGKKFIAVGCHFDVEEWLQPDWIFDTDAMQFIDLTKEVGLKKNRPDLKFEIVRAKDKSAAWRAFSKYHYLSHSHNNSASVYLLYLDDTLCGFYSVLNFPHAQIRKAVRGHRLVVLPDFQGMGLGLRLRSMVAEMYVKDGYRFFATTTNPAILNGLRNNKNWILTRVGRTSAGGPKSQLAKSSSSNRITTSWEYIL